MSQTTQRTSDAQAYEHWGKFLSGSRTLDSMNWLWERGASGSRAGRTLRTHPKLTRNVWRSEIDDPRACRASVGVRRLGSGHRLQVCRHRWRYPARLIVASTMCPCFSCSRRFSDTELRLMTQMFRYRLSDTEHWMFEQSL